MGFKLNWGWLLRGGMKSFSAQLWDLNGDNFKFSIKSIVSFSAQLWDLNIYKTFQFLKNISCFSAQLWDLNIAGVRVLATETLVLAPNCGI